MASQDRSSDVQCISDDDDLILRDVVAVVEVRTKTENRSRGVQYQLEQLGAKVVSKLSDDVTHLIWKNGKKPTLERARKKGIHIVSVLWVESCKQNQEHVAEEMFHVSTKEEGSPLFLPRTRRRKFMEPKPLEEDLQDSRERLAKRRKRDVPSPISVPGRVLVRDTPYRHSPTWYLAGPPFSPSLIPNTPDSMRACLDKLNAIRNRSPLDHVKPCLGDSPTCGTFNSSGSGHSSPLERPDIVGSLIDRLLHSDNDEPSPLEKICRDSKTPGTSLRTKTKSSKILFQSDGATNHKEETNGASAGQKEMGESPEHSPPVPAHDDVKRTRVGKGKQVPFSKESQRSSRANQQSSMEKGKEDEIQTVKGRSSRLSRRYSGTIADEHLKSSGRKGLSRRCDGNVRNLDDRTVVNVENDSNMKERNDSNSNVEEESPEAAEEPPLTASQSSRSKLCRGRSGRSRRSLVDKQDTIMDITNLKGHLGGNSDPEEAERKSVGRCKPLSRKSKGRSSKVIQSGPEAETIVLDSPEGKRGGGDVDVNRDEASKKGNQNASKNKEKQGIQRDSADNQLQDERNTPGQKRLLSDTCGGDIERRKPKRRRLLKMQTFNEPPSILIEPSHPSGDTAKENSKTAAILRRSPLSREKETGGGDCEISRTKTEKEVRRNEDSATEVIRPSRRSAEEFRETGKKAKCVRRGVASRKAVKHSKSSSGESGCSGDEDSDVDVDEKKNSSRNTSGALMQRHKTKKPTIVMTSMHRSDQDIVVSVVRSLGGYKITDSVSPTTTHVVTGDHRRTLNVLSAIAHGCWLLSKEWVLNSLESGHWLPEEPFEVHSTFPAAKISRELKSQSETQNSHLDLFSELGPIFVRDSTSPPKERLVDLLLLCGALLCKGPDEARLCVGDSKRPTEIRAVREKWVLDCISELKTLPIDGYLI